MQVGWVKIGDFRQITGYISKTVQDRHIVQILSKFCKSVKSLTYLNTFFAWNSGPRTLPTQPTALLPH